MTRVFVYGTLMRGHWNSYILKDSKFVGKAVTKGRFLLTNVGFPYLIPPERLSEAPQNASPAPVVGEVYEVTDEAVMASLDALEGVRYNHYAREEIEVVHEDDRIEDSIVVNAYIPCDVDGAFLSGSLCRRTKEDGFYEWRPS